MKAQIGNLTNGFSFAGSNAYKIENIISVKELIESLKREFEIAYLELAKNSCTAICFIKIVKKTNLNTKLGLRELFLIDIQVQ